MPFRMAVFSSRFLLILSIHFLCIHGLRFPSIRKTNFPIRSTLTSENAPAVMDSDFTDYKLSLLFDGFGAVEMPALITLGERSSATFSGGIQSLKPGFWRSIKDGGNDVIEITMPIFPEYMLFFDIWEPAILWRCNVDLSSKSVRDGEVITNKKRFGIIPYTETLATFAGDLLFPGDDVPTLDVPSTKDLSFVPPIDFESPYDMKRYPQYFDPEYVDWWFANEVEYLLIVKLCLCRLFIYTPRRVHYQDAIARGEPPPTRPKPFFNPKGSASGSQDASSNDPTGKSFRQRPRSSGTGSNAAFGKKK